GFGNDANDCSISHPCQTFGRALSQTLPGGVVHCLDAGPFGFATITVPVTIDCAGGVVVGFNGQDTLTVNAPRIVVILRNMTIDSSPNFSGASGVNFVNGSALHLENVKISGFQGGGGGTGIRFAPPSGVAAELVVTDTIVSNNGSGGTGGGIV